jgi:hypothetical protein
VLCSGRAATGFAIASAILAFVIANAVKQSQTKHIKAKKIASGFTFSMTLPNEGEAVLRLASLAAPSASLTRI